MIVMKAMGMESDLEVVQILGTDPRYSDLLPSIESRPFGVSLLIAGHDEHGPSFTEKRKRKLKWTSCSWKPIQYGNSLLKQHEMLNMLEALMHAADASLSSDR